MRFLREVRPQEVGVPEAQHDLGRKATQHPRVAHKLLHSRFQRRQCEDEI